MNLIGRMLANRYEILEVIGKGGMATVYRANDHVLNRFVAVKVLNEEFITDVEFIRRFKSEAQTAAGLTHPNIVSIFDVGNEGDVYYIVMELIQGKTLKEIIVEDGKLSWKWSLNIAIQIAAALETAHKHNLIHRDIKPHNIIITEDGMAKVTDFGIAKAVSNSTITAFGSTIGSVHYFSPEHAKGGATDGRSDIYSLGVVMYEMLTGRVPFDADTPVSVALMQVQEEPIEPVKINPEIPISINNIILKAMEKDPDDRYQNATEMLIDLSTALKRPNDDFVKGTRKFDTLQTQKLSTLYDIEGKAKDDEDDEYEEEEERPRNKKKKKGFFAFMKEHVILSFVCVAVLLFSLALGGTVLIMNLGQTKDAQIPNLVKDSEGKRMTEAKAVSAYNDTDFKKKHNLKVEYVEEEKDPNGEDVEPGYVVRQDPAYRPNYKIKVKDQITIYVRQAGAPKDITMVDLSGKTKEEVETILHDLGYLGVVTFNQEASDTVDEGKVISQSIQPGIVFKDNEALTIVLSGGSDKIDVPNTLGKEEAAARTMLETAGFKVQVETQEESSGMDGVVIKQSNTDKAAVGDTITITIRKVTQNAKMVVTINWTKYEAKAKAEQEADATITTDPETGEEIKVLPDIEKYYKNVTVGVKVGDSRFGGITVKAKGIDTINIEGKETQTVSLEINGYNKGSQTVTFGKDSDITFLPEP